MIKPSALVFHLAGYWLLRNGGRGPWGPILSFTVPTGG
jgi:hypothetical protein